MILPKRLRIIAIWDLLAKYWRDNVIKNCCPQSLNTLSPSSDEADDCGELNMVLFAEDADKNKISVVETSKK